MIGEFQRGATPEQISQSYETAALADVYGVIAYYLRHREEMETYLAQRERQSDEVRRRIEAWQGDLGNIRERLLARRSTFRGEMVKRP